MSGKNNFVGGGNILFSFFKGGNLKKSLGNYGLNWTKLLCFNPFKLTIWSGKSWKFQNFYEIQCSYRCGLDKKSRNAEGNKFIVIVYLTIKNALKKFGQRPGAEMLKF